MDGTVNRGARVECRVGQPIAAVAEPAGFPVRRDAAIQAVRRPCVQRALLRSARDTRSATPTAVRTAAFWLAAGAGAATDGFLLDSALTCCLLTVWATPAGQSIGLGGSLQGRDCIDALQERKPLHIPHRNAKGPPTHAGGPCVIQMSAKSHPIAHKGSQKTQTRHCSRPCRKMSWGRSMPMKTILLWRFSPSAHCGPRSLPMSWCTPWKMTLRSVPCMFSTPL